MEQRKRITLAERLKLNPVEKRKRTGFQDQQDKPKAGKKGKRGQAEGMRSKATNRGKTVNTRKKPGRAKQAQKAKAKASRRKPEK